MDLFEIINEFYKMCVQWLLKGLKKIIYVTEGRFDSHIFVTKHFDVHLPALWAYLSPLLRHC